jgi:putative heme iron utilization protein
MKDLALFTKLAVFLNTHRSGSIASMSTYLPSYPFASTVTFTLDEHYQPVILISHLAEHTKNLVADPKASLSVSATMNPQTLHEEARVTLVGDFAKEVTPYGRDKYLGLFPKHKNYLKIGGFDFFTLKTKKVRFIGGFGDITWTDFSEDTFPFHWAQEAAGILEHMNEDHSDALSSVAKHLYGADSAKMTAVDPFGFHVRTEKGIFYAPFESPSKDLQDVRQHMIKITRNSRT